MTNTVGPDVCGECGRATVRRNHYLTECRPCRRVWTRINLLPSPDGVTSGFDIDAHAARKARQ